MTHDTENVILQVLRDFREEVHEEFRVVKAKQDITNGRVNVLEAERDERSGYERAVGEKKALRRADVLSWRAVVVPGFIGLCLLLLGLAAGHLLPIG